MNTKITPPKFAAWLNRLLLCGNEFDNRLNEYDEIFNQLLKEQGRIKAASWYWSQTLISIPNLIINRILWGGAMLSNYLKIAVRNISAKRYALNLLIL